MRARGTRANAFHFHVPRAVPGSPGGSEAYAVVILKAPFAKNGSARGAPAKLKFRRPRPAFGTPPAALDTDESAGVLVPRQELAGDGPSAAVAEQERRRAVLLTDRAVDEYFHVVYAPLGVPRAQRAQAPAASHDVPPADGPITHGTPLRVLVAEVFPAHLARKRMLPAALGSARLAAGARARLADALPTAETLPKVRGAGGAPATLALPGAGGAERLFTDATHVRLRTAADEVPTVGMRPPVVVTAPAAKYLVTIPASLPVLRAD